MRIKKRICVLLSGLIMPVAMAGWTDAPVLDASADLDSESSAVISGPETPVLDAPGDSEEVVSEEQDAPPEQLPDFPVEARVSEPQQLALDTSNMSSIDRLKLVERQVNNMVSMNFSQQIGVLQQQLAELRGQLEVQGHELQTLNQQLKGFYQDLDARLAGGHSLSQSSVAVKSAKPPTEVGTQAQLKESNAYQSAFNLLGKRSYSGAKGKFLSYLHDYPKGQYAADAHYWLGEINMIDKDTAAARNQFEIVLKQYPKSAKAVDAELKLAIIHANTGQLAKAKAELQAIVKKHPDSAVAQLASIRLQQIDQ